MQNSTIIRDIPGYWLVLDASCPTTRVALFQNGKLRTQIDSKENAVESLLSGLRQLIQAENIGIRDIKGFIYCIGPGSILGIRLSIIAIKTWCSIHRIAPEFVMTYNSLFLAGISVSTASEKPEPKFAVISEWKKNHWNALQIEAGKPSAEITIWNDESIHSCPYPLYQLAQRKLWADTLPKSTPVEYRLALLETPEIRLKALSPMKNWEIYTPEKKDYVKWTRERHR
jgi:tRNA threonylcarbamoyladenosine biosynthesis protein TsaB